MRGALIILCVVWVLDAAVATVLWSWWFMAACLVNSVLVVILIKTRPSTLMNISNSDWDLGDGFEISYPDRPVAEHCTLSLKTIMQGMLCFGQPGAGKSESFSLGYLNFIRKKLGSGVAFFDGKGDLDIVKKTIGMAGQPDYFFSSELDNSNTINLMAGDAKDVIDRLSAVLIGTSNNTSFYADEQYTALTRIIPILVGLDEPATLRDLYVVLVHDDAAQELLRRAKTSNVNAEELSMARQWFDLPTDKRIANIAGLLNRLFIYVSGPLAARLNAYEPDIDIAAILQRGQFVYFHLPYTKFSATVAVAIIEMFAVEARRRQLSGSTDTPFFPLVFDDWGKFVHDNFGPFMARARSASMPAAFSFQSVAQVKEVSPLFLEQMDDLAATKIFLRVQGLSTIEYASNILGSYEVTEVSTSKDRLRASNSVSVRENARVNGRAFKELDTGQAYISTQVTKDGKARNPLWLMRFPLPEFGDWRSKDTPKTQHSERLTVGLRFWDRYLNPSKLKDIQAALNEARASEQSQLDQHIRQAQSDMQAELNANAGWSQR